MNTRKLFILLAATILVVGCEDRFAEYEDEPSWLGTNVYDYLASRGDCNYYVKLIEDCGYQETMQKTGSNTLFFCADSAFEQFFSADYSENGGVTSYEKMPTSLKLLILRSSMIENAQLIERLSVSDHGGSVLRRVTMMDVEDTIPVITVDEMPKNDYFAEFDEPIKMYLDATKWTLVQLFPDVLEAKDITDEDIKILCGVEREDDGDAFLFGNKIVQKDITCKNGYLHELGTLMIPADNIAQYIRGEERASQFNALMDRFCEPVPYEVTADGEQIYELRYFNQDLKNTGRGLTTDVNGNVVSGSLYYDPGWNLYQSSPESSNSTVSSYESDMAAMFVPTNEAMEEYFCDDPESEGYDIYVSFDGNWDNVPDNIVADILSNHQKTSFLTALPSKFESMKDEMGYEMEVTKDNIVDCYVGRNGVAYLVDKVLPPLDYRTVMGPAKVDPDFNIFNLAMGDDYCQLQYFLRSLVSTYNFFITPDESMKNYVNPVSLGYTTSRRASWDFYINSSGEIQATIYSLVTGDSIGINRSGGTSGELTSHLDDILNQQTLVGELTPGQEWYITKGYAPVQILWTGSEPTQIKGAGNDAALNITSHIDKTNGTTHYIDGIVQPSRTSIYATLGEHAGSSVSGSTDDKFKEFYDLLLCSGYFTQSPTTSSRALDNAVSFLGQYHYSVYVPTNEAILEAQEQGLIPTVDEVESPTLTEEEDAAGMSIVDKQDSLRNIVKRFVKYHFQDGAVFIKGENESDQQYLSGTLNEVTNKFYPLYVTQDGSSIQILDYANWRKSADEREYAHVVTTDGLYNLNARDIVVNSATLTSATKIETYAFAVIHQIDRILQFN